jgi:hypothetical protein
MSDHRLIASGGDLNGMVNPGIPTPASPGKMPPHKLPPAPILRKSRISGRPDRARPIPTSIHR